MVYGDAVFRTTDTGMEVSLITLFGMKEKYGYGLQYLRDINAYAKQNASEENIEKVIKTVEDIKKYVGSVSKYD